MKRALASGNITHIDSRHTHPVVMAKCLFDTPVYVHTGLGEIPYEGNTYLGLGTLAGISGLEETEALVPAPITISMDGLDPTLFTEALNASNYGDRITLYWGYRLDNGSLIDEPWILYKGRVEIPKVVRGAQNTVSLIIQHELAVLNKRTNTKYTNEEQQRRYPGDTAFARVEQMSTVQLSWGRKEVPQGGRGRGVGPGLGGGEPAPELR